MIASLPMYDWPEVRQATDRWWTGIARHLGVSLPLSREENYPALWHSPKLLFSQTCGYPFTHEFKGKFKLVATPHYGADGCDGPNYRSIIFARQLAPLSSFRGSIAAVNAPDSMSGMLGLKLVFQPLAKQGRFFARAIESGSHIASMKAVREGLAEVCAIDAVCVGLARRHRPEYLEGLVEIARSPSVPSLPFVTIGGDVERLREALAAAFADPALHETRDQLLLTGFSVPGVRAYDRITQLESDTERAGGLQLL